MHRILLFSFLVLFGISDLHAQLGNLSYTISSDRPGQSISATPLGARFLQVQAGLALRRFDLLGQDYNIWGTEGVLRYGLTESFEINGQVNGSKYPGSLSSFRYYRSRIDAVQAGIRFKILDGEGLVPKIAFQYRLNWQVDLSNDRPAYRLGSIFTIATSQSLTKRLGLGTNNGLDFPNAQQASWFYTVILSYQIANRWNVFAENYGNVRPGNFQTSFDAGISFLADQNLLFDLYGGGRNGEWFISAGISWRIRHGMFLP